jgi:hypothetical protein
VIKRFEVKLLLDVDVSAAAAYGERELEADIDRVVVSMFPSGEFGTGRPTELQGVSITERVPEPPRVWNEDCAHCGDAIEKTENWEHADNLRSYFLGVDEGAMLCESCCMEADRRL